MSRQPLEDSQDYKANAELSDAQLEQIAKIVADRHGNEFADRAADKVIANVQLEVGKSALRAISYVAGAVMVAVMAWLAAHGYISIDASIAKK